MADREFTNVNGIKVCDQTARDNIPTRTSQLENDSNFITTIGSRHAYRIIIYITIFLHIEN